MAVLHTIDVPTPSRSYQVLVGRNLAGELAVGVRRLTHASRVALIADSTVASLHAHKILRALEDAELSPRLISFPAGEAHKNMASLSELLEQVAQAGLTRDDCVVALGGGVTGDMAGLVAALYLRGIALVQAPTSLLAMVDSSVGGKTAVDIQAGKNLVGAFLQPHLVVADIDMLDTLPEPLLADGFGEIIKHGLIADAKLFEYLYSSNLGQLTANKEQLAAIVAKNVAIKRDVVVADEQESGARQLLNFGHTIGHAIEAAENFTLSHGACVAVGMCCITRATEQLGWTQAGTLERLEACVRAYNLPTTTDIAPKQLMGYIAHDKKRHSNSMNIAVATCIGSAEIRKLSLTELEQLVELACAGA